MKKRQIKVLLFEDNPGDVRLIREMLSEATDVIPKIECVDRLDAGLKRLAKGDINLLLLDLGLHDSQGLDTFVKVHSQATEVPIVVMTGLEDEELGLKAVQMGAQDYLIKGQVYGNILIRAVRYAIERKRAVEKLKKYRDHLEELVEESKKAEEKIKHLNLVLRAIRNVNQLITKEKDRDRLLKGACNNLIDNRGYHSVWIALLDKDGELVTTVECGLGKDFSPMVELLERGELTNCGRIVLSQSGVLTIKDPASTCSECPLAQKYKGRGAMTVRLKHSKKVYGLMSVSIPRDFTKYKEEQALFNEIAGDIAFALFNIEREERRKQAEEQQRESEEKYRTLFETLSLGIFIIDQETGQILDVNDAATHIYGYSREEWLNMKNTDVSAEPDKTREATIDLPEYIPVRYHKKKNGTIFPVEMVISTFMLKGRQVVIATSQDITERKKEETVRNVLFNISKATAKTGTLDDLLAMIHKQVGTLMDAKNFFVCLAHDTEKNLYTFPYYRDINPKDIVELDMIFKITEGLTHHVLKTKKYLLGNKEELKKIGVIGTVPESWLGIPLKTERGDVNGVIAVQSYEKKAYSEKDAQVLSIIASNITGALKYKKAEEQIRASLTEKEILLQEIHHRVKNNMQIISSLIKLQSRHIKDEKALGTFKSIQNRVRSMAAIHEQLYKSKDFARVDFAEYVQSLTVHLLSAYGIDSKAIKLNIEIKDVLLDIDTAIPCGLIINELISNSLIHAFPEEKKGEINITIQYLNKNEIELIVSDNGVGLPKKMDFRDTESMGLHLVTILAEDQLQGDIKLDRTGGTRFRIRIKMKPRRENLRGAKLPIT